MSTPTGTQAGRIGTHLAQEKKRAHVVFLNLDSEPLGVFDRDVARVGASLDGEVKRVLLLL